MAHSPRTAKRRHFIIPNYAANIGAYVAPIDVETTGNPPPTSAPSEGIGSFFDGLLYGNLSDNTSWSATLGGIVGGLIPGVGLIADVRDLGAAVAHVADGNEGAWLELGASIVGFVPGGDIAKGVAKGATTATKAVAKVGAEVVDDVAKIAKGGTAAAADGLSSAEKAAGKKSGSSWTKMRNDHWKNRASQAIDGEFSPQNLERMRQGKPPLHPEVDVPKELHHKVPRHQGGTHSPDNLQEVWPWEHEQIDPFRRYNGPRPSGD